MIFLEQNSINNVVVSLQSNSTLFTYSGIQPYYLFEFKSPTTNATLRFVSDNIASVSARTSYDEFNITTSGASYQNISAGTINLNPGIFWQYQIFEQNQQYNFNPLNSVSLVKSGKVFYSAATSDFTYVSMTGNTNFITFNTY